MRSRTLPLVLVLTGLVGAVLVVSFRHVELRPTDWLPLQPVGEVQGDCEAGVSPSLADYYRPGEMWSPGNAEVDPSDRVGDVRSFRYVSPSSQLLSGSLHVQSRFHPIDSRDIRGGFVSPFAEQPPIEPFEFDGMPISERYRHLLARLREELCFVSRGLEVECSLGSHWTFAHLLSLGRSVVPIAIADLKADGPREDVFELLEALLPQVPRYRGEADFMTNWTERRAHWLRWWDTVGSRENWE